MPEIVHVLFVGISAREISAEQKGARVDHDIIIDSWHTRKRVRLLKKKLIGEGGGSSMGNRKTKRKVENELRKSEEKGHQAVFPRTKIPWEYILLLLLILNIQMKIIRRNRTVQELCLCVHSGKRNEKISEHLLLSRNDRSRRLHKMNHLKRHFKSVEVEQRDNQK